MNYIAIVKPPIKDTPKEDKPPNKGQAESIFVYTLYRIKSPLREDNLSTKDKTTGPESVFIKRFHCIPSIVLQGILLCARARTTVPCCTSTVMKQLGVLKHMHMVRFRLVIEVYMPL